MKVIGVIVWMISLTWLLVGCFWLSGIEEKSVYDLYIFAFILLSSVVGFRFSSAL